MGVNKHLPHVLVFPEDDANRQLAIGFVLGALDTRQIQVLPVAGGWQQLLKAFESDHAAGMEKYSNRYMVLLIDFDGHEQRVDHAKNEIRERLRGRVFVLGALTEPEAFRRAGLGTYETIGRHLALDCRDGSDTTWAHRLLKHNAAEVARLRDRVRPILF